MLSRLLRIYLLRRYRGELAAVLVLQFVATLAALLLPSFNADVIDNGIAKGDVGHVWRTSVWMLSASLLQAVCTIGAVRAGARAAMGFGADVRRVLFTRVLSFSAREVNHFGAPSLITRNTNDVQQIQHVVLMACLILVGAPIMMVGGVVMALREDVGLSWLVAVAVPVLLIAIGLIITRMVPLFRRTQARLDSLNRVLREQITGVRVVRAFVREEQERHRFAVANDDLSETTLAVGRLMTLAFPVVMLVMNTSTVAVLWFGGLRVDAGQVQVGALFAYISYLIQILMSVMMATMVASMVPRASVSAERVMEVLDTESSIVASPDPVGFGPSRGVLEVQDVSFRYPGAEEPVLCEVSFCARPGMVTAIVGGTGAGKTTLINLLARLIDPTAGTVRLDGADIRLVDPAQLWDRVGLVPQRPYLFSGTIASNLRLGAPQASDAQLWQALEIAQARDFVERYEQGLQAPIAQGGTNVSGGQRQRLCIARALVARPELYLFDDAFSALDLATDARLRAALQPQIRSATVVIVAQRISSVIDANQIIVLEAGRVVGIGSHQELLAACPTYQQIVASQVATTGHVA